MAWSSPRTWVTSEVVTAAHMNQEIRDNLLAIVPNQVSGVSWTPDLQASTTSPTGFSVGGRRYRIGALQFVWARFVVGDDAGTGTYFVELPVAASGLVGSGSSGSGTTIGSWQSRDEGNVGANQGGTLVLRSSTTVHFQLPIGGVVTHERPFIWGGAGGLTSGDVLSLQAVYPVA